MRDALAALAQPRPATPLQARGGGHRDGIASSLETSANGGNGRAQVKTAGALDAAAPLSRQDRPDWTVPERKGYDEATSRRIAADSTATSDMYANTDGSHTRIVSAAPVNYRGADGSWQKIDSRLVRDSSGKWRVAANSSQISVAGISAAHQRLGVERGQAELSRVTLAPGRSVGWTLQGASLPDPAVSGSSATYADVLPSTDVVLDAFHSGVKETLVLRSKDAPSSWVFELDLQGLTAVVDADGGVSLKDVSGAVQARIPPGYLEDSNVHPQSGEGRISTNLTYELTKVNGKPALKVTADAAWLADPARVWPVKADPTTVYTNGSAFVSNYYSNTDTSGYAELKVGRSPTESPAMDAFGLLKFDTVSSSYMGQRITSAWISFHVFWVGGCPNPATFHIREITSGWTPNGVRWGTQPSLGLEVAGGPGYPNGTICGNAARNPEVGAWWGYSLNNANGMAVVNGWTGGTRTNNGLALTTSYGPAQDWARVSSVNTSKVPYLTIDYTPNVAPEVTGQYPTHGYASPTLTPELAVTATDSDAYPRAMTYQFLVYDPANTSTPVEDSGWIPSRSFKVRDGKLSWSKSYVWTVLANDGNAISTTQAMNVLSTTVPQAPITSGLSQNPDKGFSTQVGNYTTSAVDAQVPGVGPPLAISRAYNSRDARLGQAFGLGWSSILDAKATETTDSGATSPRVVTITYPTGQDVTFGRNNDGTFTPPSGRFSSLRAVTGGGYELVDKEGTKYTFTVLKTAGVYGLTSVSDAVGRTMTLTYTSGLVTRMIGASGRKLNLTWSGSNVATVANEAGDTWGYTYTSGLLTKVCPPTSTTACHRYEYGNNSLYSTAVLDAQPHTYWRLNEPLGGLTAQSSVVDNTDTATGTYSNVSLGAVDGPLPSATGWTPPKAASFNGSNSYVDLTQPKVAMKRSVQSVSLWFKTSSSGVLLGYQDNTMVSGASNYHNPVLYVGVDGLLRTGFWPVPAINSTAPVNNNAWHHVVLSASGSAQQMWLDGTLVATTTGTADLSWASNVYLGAGVWTGWPSTSGTNGYFNGSIAEFAWYDRPLTGAQVASMRSAGTTVAKPLTKVIRPSNGVTAQIGYHPVSGIVTSLTDDNNGAWTIHEPTIAGSTAVHASAVLAGAPADYFRMVDTRNEVNGVTGTFSGATFGASVAGPLGDTAVLFNGGSMTGSGPSIDTSKSYSVSSWVYLTSNAGNYQIAAVDAVRGSPFRFGYESASNRWRMKVCDADIDNQPCPGAVSTSVPALNTWTHLAATVEASSKTVKLYVNGQLESTVTVNPLWKAAGPLLISRLKWNGGYTDGWRGRLAEVATYQRVLLPEQVKAQYEARDKAANAGAGAGVLAKTVKVTDPGLKDTFYTYDLTNGGRQVKQIDSRGGVTSYGYDVGGFLLTTTDPNGNMTVEEHDVRGNVIAKTTCQDRSENKCSTVYTSYHPDETTKILTPDPRNDMPKTVRDGRSESKNDPAYLTTNTYDALGNLTSVTDPLGRVTSTEYTEVPTLSSSAPCNPNEAVEKAFDRNWTGLTAKFCSLAASAWLQAGYTKVQTITTITISHGQSGGEGAGSNTKDFDILTSMDGTAWTTQAQVRGNTSGTTTHTLPTAVQAKYLKIVVLTPTQTTDPATRIYEVEAHNVTVPAGLPRKKNSPSGAVETMEYFPTGDVASVTDSTGLVTTFVYDAVGRVASKTVKAESGDLVSTFAYDGQGRVVTQTDPELVNRVSGAKHTAETTIVYGVDGNIDTQTVSDTNTGADASRTASNGYNARGQLASTVDALNKTRTFTYDLYGNRVSETDQTGAKFEYEYDASGQPTKTTLKGYTGDPNNPSAPSDLIIESRVYDLAGRLASVTDAMGWETLFTYTDNGLTATVTRKNPATSQTFLAESNVYDAAGNVIEKVTNNGTTRETFVVDAANRVTSQTLDPGGLARTTEFTHGADDTVLTTKSFGPGAVQYVDTAYDLSGGRTSQVVSATGSGGLAARWRLDTNPADSFGNSPGKANNNLTWSTDHGGSAVFDGTQEIQTAGPVIDSSQSYTISAWAKLDDTAATRIIAGQWGTQRSAINLEYSSYFGKWAAVSASTDPGTSLVALSATPPTLNTWTHLAAVYDVKTLKVTLYVNGVAQASTINNHRSWRGKGPFTIGGPGGSRFKGAIDDVQAYQKALSASEISAVYNGTAPSAGPAARTSWQLDKRGLITAQTDANGNRTLYEYDSSGQLTMTTSPSVSVEENGGTPVDAMAVNTVGYNTFGEVAEQRDAKGRVTTTIRDAVGQAKEIRLPSYTPPGSSTPINPVSKMEYDFSGQLVKTIDPLLNETTRVYDQLGRLAKQTAPNGGETKYTYTLNGEPLSATDPNGARSEVTYDYMGRKLTTTKIERSPSASYVTAYGYNTAGRLQSVTPPGRNATTYDYNAAGELTMVTDAAGNPVRFTYDGLGRRTESIDPDSSKATVTFDFASRPTIQRRLAPNGAELSATSVVYDAAGNVLSTTDARGNTTSFTYDATGLITQMIEPESDTESITSRFAYDVTGKPTRFTDGRDYKFVTTYNTWGLPESEVEPDGATFTTIYDGLGRAVTRNEPGGVSVTSAYNAMSQLIGQTGSGADAATAARSFDYDTGGRLKTVTEGGNTTTLSYNDRGMLTSTSGAAGVSSFSYTADGLMATRTDAAGTATYDYDTAGRLSTVADPLTAGTATYGYNNLNQVSSITYGASGNKQTYTYDGLRRLDLDILERPDQTDIASIDYGYDANGNLTSKITTDFAGAASNAYAYDKADRLISWNGTNYEYDKSGNRTKIGSRTLAYDSRNRLTDDGNFTYTYSDRGTLTGTTEGTVTTPSTFDAYGQQISQGSQSYTYDGGGRVLTTSSGAAFSYSGAGNDPASDGTALYSRDPGGNLSAVKEGAGAGLWAWTDQHDDVVGQFTSTGTTLAGSRTYNPFGKVLATAGFAGNLGYQSGWTDPGTTRVNMHSRWYNPETAQFSSRDSVTVSPRPQSIRANRYAYGDGNPMTVTDPTGHWGFNPFKAVANAVSKVTTAVSNTWNTVTSTVSSWASSAWNTATSWASSAYNWAKEKVTQAYDWAKQKVNQVKNWVTSKVTQLKNWAVQKYNQAKEAVKQTYNKAKQAIVEGAKRAVEATKKAAAAVAEAGKKYVEAHVNAIKDAYEKTKNWIEEHKAEIAGFVVGAIVGLGCGALIGWTGVGAVACGALAGAAGSFVTGYMQGKRGWALVGDVAVGALGGALGGGVGSFVGGKVASMIAGKFGGGLISRVAGGMFSGAVSGAASGAAEGGLAGAAAYGAQCLGGAACTAGGFFSAAGSGAAQGAKWGGLSGGIFGGAGGFKAQPAAPQAAPGPRAPILNQPQGPHIYRTGSRTDTALTDGTGVSFRSSVSSSADGRQVFKPGDKIWSVDTRQLPEGSFRYDNDPDGHVSVFATPDEIRGAVVPHGEENPLEQLGLNRMDEPGSYKLPKPPKKKQ